MPRIGVFGGTFDPPHLGHVATALEVQHALELDIVMLVVAGDPWQKTAEAEITPAETRLAMTRAAVDGLDGLEVSAIEIERRGPSYTADTLEILRDLTHASWFLIVGSDAAEGLDTWHRPDDVARLATTVVVDRGGREGGRPPEGWAHEVVDVPALEISSSDIRRRVAAGEPIRGLVPEVIADRIEMQGLYRRPG
ncbi:MAG: nicotinate-nucleotide adenylyltransferase [Actinomycetota bacterium]